MKNKLMHKRPHAYMEPIIDGFLWLEVAKTIALWLIFLTLYFHWS